MIDLNRSWLELIEVNSFITGIIEKLDFWDANSSTNFKHQ